jgi:hypothetical protein
VKLVLSNKQCSQIHRNSLPELLPL